MSRTPVVLRDADSEDVPFLAELWSESLRRADPAEQAADLELVVKEADESPEQRLLIAVRDDEPVGAVFLRVTTMSGINLEPVVRVIGPSVAAHRLRQGVGRLLMDASVAWAEELGVGYLTTGVKTSSRACNRFMSRLSLGPTATLRVAPTHAVRAKLTALMPTSQRVSERATGRRHVSQVLAARRQLRRQADAGPDPRLDVGPDAGPDEPAGTP